MTIEYGSDYDKWFTEYGNNKNTTNIPLSCSYCGATIKESAIFVTTRVKRGALVQHTYHFPKCFNEIKTEPDAYFAWLHKGIFTDKDPQVE